MRILILFIVNFLLSFSLLAMEKSSVNYTAEDNDQSMDFSVELAFEQVLMRESLSEIKQYLKEFFKKNFLSTDISKESENVGNLLMFGYDMQSKKGHCPDGKLSEIGIVYSSKQLKELLYEAYPAMEQMFNVLNTSGLLTSYYAVNMLGKDGQYEVFFHKPANPVRYWHFEVGFLARLNNIQLNASGLNKYSAITKQLLMTDDRVKRAFSNLDEAAGHLLAGLNELIDIYEMSKNTIDVNDRAAISDMLHNEIEYISDIKNFAKIAYPSLLEAFMLYEYLHYLKYIALSQCGVCFLKDALVNRDKSFLSRIQVRLYRGRYSLLPFMRQLALIFIDTLAKDKRTLFDLSFEKPQGKEPKTKPQIEQPIQKSKKKRKHKAKRKKSPASPALCPLPVKPVLELKAETIVKADLIGKTIQSESTPTQPRKKYPPKDPKLREEQKRERNRTIVQLDKANNDKAGKRNSVKLTSSIKPALVLNRQQANAVINQLSGANKQRFEELFSYSADTKWTNEVPGLLIEAVEEALAAVAGVDEARAFKDWFNNHHHPIHAKETHLPVSYVEKRRAFFIIINLVPVDFEVKSLSDINAKWKYQRRLANNALAKHKW